ncbi:transmembrane protein 209, partial [Tanacetum coccineum]
MANVTTATSSKPVTKFTVYQNPAVSAALTTNSLRPSKLTIFFILTLLSASALSLISFIL